MYLTAIYKNYSSYAQFLPYLDKLAMGSISNYYIGFILPLDEGTTELNEDNLAPLRQYLQENPGKFKVKIPEGITSIEQGAFSESQGITQVTLRNPQTEIDSGIFKNCTDLEKVSLLDFHDQSELEFSIKELNPNSICVTLKVNLYASGQNYTLTPEKLVPISKLLSEQYPDKKIHLVISESQTNIVVSFECFSVSIFDETPWKNLVSVKLLDVTEIKRSAFENCAKLTFVTFSPKLHILGDSAFSGCSQLREVRLPANISRIERNTFSSCTALQYLALPSNLEYLESGFIFNCPNLQTIDVEDIHKIYKTDRYNRPGTLLRILLRSHHDCTFLHYSHGLQYRDSIVYHKIIMNLLKQNPFKDESEIDHTLLFLLSLMAPIIHIRGAQNFNNNIDFARNCFKILLSQGVSVDISDHNVDMGIKKNIFDTLLRADNTDIYLLIFPALRSLENFESLQEKSASLQSVLDSYKMTLIDDLDNRHQPFENNISCCLLYSDLLQFLSINDLIKLKCLKKPVSPLNPISLNSCASLCFSPQQKDTAAEKGMSPNDDNSSSAKDAAEKRNLLAEAAEKRMIGKNNRS